MYNHKKNQSGFTIIELMIAVAIIGVLAGLAIPNYQRSLFRARQAETVVIIGNLRVNQWSYFGTYDCFANTEQHPLGTVGAVPLPWNSVAGGFSNPCDGTPRTLATLGLELSISNSYYQYQCAAQISMGIGTNEFVCSAQADLDADGVIQEFLFCTDSQQTGTGLNSPQTGTPCVFPYSVYRASLGVY